MTNESKRAYSVREFGRRNDVGSTFTYAQIKAGRLRAIKAGRRTLITAEAENAWLDALPAIPPKGAPPERASVLTESRSGRQSDRTNS